MVAPVTTTDDRAMDPALAAGLAVLRKRIVEPADRRTLLLATRAKGFDPEHNTTHSAIVTVLDNVLPGVAWRTLPVPAEAEPDFTPAECAALAAAGVVVQRCQIERDAALAAYLASYARALGTSATTDDGGVDPSIVHRAMAASYALKQKYGEAEAKLTAANRDKSKIYVQAGERRTGAVLAAQAVEAAKAARQREAAKAARQALRSPPNAWRS